jgi:7-cyano-7-deazaguanine synthase in queuosine biosynthesis
MIDSVAIVSGGLDSVTLLHYLVRLEGRTPAVLTFTYGQKHSKELGVDYARTWSCYEGDVMACGSCPTCAERLQAFAELGQIDPLSYKLSSGLHPR